MGLTLLTDKYEIQLGNGVITILVNVMELRLAQPPILIYL